MKKIQTIMLTLGLIFSVNFMAQAQNQKDAKSNVNNQINRNKNAKNYVFLKQPFINIMKMYDEVKSSKEDKNKYTIMKKIRKELQNLINEKKDFKKTKITISNINPKKEQKVVIDLPNDANSNLSNEYLETIKSLDNLTQQNLTDSQKKIETFLNNLQKAILDHRTAFLSKAAYKYTKPQPNLKKGKLLNNKNNKNNFDLTYYNYWYNNKKPQKQNSNFLKNDKENSTPKFILKKQLNPNTKQKNYFIVPSNKKGIENKQVADRNIYNEIINKRSENIKNKNFKKLKSSIKINNQNMIAQNLKKDILKSIIKKKLEEKKQQ